jgi:3-hydroxyacyl-[acyl-carrier-protein] dehydratase
MDATRAEILAAIPHREPFLFVDRILERSATRIVTEWRVPPDADFFRGHYPGNPIVPGVLICESAAQAGAILCALAGKDARSDGVPLLARIANARFRRRVAPGETLRFEVELRETAGMARYLSARATCGGERVLEAEITVALAGEGVRA